MKKLNVPNYSWQTVRELTRYVIKTRARDPWASGKKSVKNFKKKFTELMRAEQSKRCAYCGCRLFEEYPHRDHIAPKELYPRWMFWPENLVLACFACNVGLKKSYDPVGVVGKSYRCTTFSIIHPYHDDPTIHIGFAAEGLKVLISSFKGSPKGQKTIELFDLSSPERSKQRAKDAIFDDDISHLHGEWLVLYRQAAEAIQTNHLTAKMSETTKHT